MKTHVAINGACGRMGQRLVALSREDPDFKLVAAVDWAGHAAQGRDAGELAGVGPLGVPVMPTLPLDARPDVLIDFSVPEGSLAACFGSMRKSSDLSAAAASAGVPARVIWRPGKSP